MSMPTVAEIVSWYLYGQKNPPSDLKDPALIRPADTPDKKFGASIEVDMNEYMTTGGGRFIKVANFNYVRKFLNGDDYNAKKPVPPGSYSTKALLEWYGISPNLDAFQYNLGRTDPDYVDRAYVFGSSKFRINDEALFIVGEDGTRSIQNISVVPVNDNFDYESSHPLAIVTNYMTENRIDPSGIGRKVFIDFVGQVKETANYTVADVKSLEALNDTYKKELDIPWSEYPGLKDQFFEMFENLKNSGVISYQDSKGRFVFLDGKDVDNNGRLVAYALLTSLGLPVDVEAFAVALIGGGGNDVLIGGDLGDELYGGKGKDILEGRLGDDILHGDDGEPGDILKGGQGFDTYYADKGDIINDSDGRGQIFLNGKKLTFATRKKGETAYSDGTNFYLLQGETLTITDSRGRSLDALTIEGFTNKSLGVYLDEEEEDDDLKPPPYNPDQAVRPYYDPLALDLNGNGTIDDTTLTGSRTYFDLTGDGIAEKTAWIGGGDGLLAFDANGNGVIDNVSELFADDQTWANGFGKLGALFDSNNDGQITAEDTRFSELRIWQDANGDGISQAGELKSLTDWGITALNTKATPSNTSTANGNQLIATGSFTRDGQDYSANALLFAYNPALTDANPQRPQGQAPELRPEIFTLPWLRGFGLVKSLHIAYQEQPKLQAKLKTERQKSANQTPFPG